MSFKIGNIKVESKVVLAPMAGVSNSPFRQICKKYGAGLLFAEMVSDKGLVYKNEKTINMLHAEISERPLVQQVFGSDIESMVKAAIYLDQNSNCDIIDINMGCPVDKVAIRNNAGSALLKDPIKVYEMVNSIVKNVSKPVSVKIRSGWDNETINAREIALKIEEAGASLITVHARTRAQGYKGLPDLDIIKEVKQAVNIPVIGNGNITDGKSALKMLNYTKCDAVMIGRASLGNPWIFNEINAFLNKEEIPERPSKKIVCKTILEHLDLLINLKGEKAAVIEMRSHGPWYLKGLENASLIRKQLVRATDSHTIRQIINN